MVEGRVIYRNSRQALKVRIVFWLLLAAGLGAVYGGWAIFTSYGLSPADGGILRPLWQRLLFGGFVALFGVAIAGGMWLYCRVYVVSIETGPDKVTVGLMSIFGRRKVSHPFTAFGEQATHRGRSHPLVTMLSGLTVNAPWQSLRVEGKRLPYLVDLQAEKVDRNAIRGLSGSGSSHHRTH